MLQSSLFSTGPVFRRSGRKLIIRTSRVARWLSLGMVNRKVVIDPDRKRVRIEDRFMWFRPTYDSYSFDLITGVSFHLNNGLRNEGFTEDGMEAYSLGLKMYGADAPNIHLFRFLGEGPFINKGPLPDWFYWYQALTDIRGTQEEDARHFVTVLSRVLNKPIVRL
jgi:hypothetical protein